MVKDIGRIFDYTSSYRLSEAATDQLLDHYFLNGELTGKEVLDAGCRVGDYSIALLRKGARRVIGVDLSGACITRARERFAGIRGGEFRQGDISNLGTFAESSFDLVVCLGTMMYLDRWQVRDAMREFVRVTRPGGIILVLFLRPLGWSAKLATAVANCMPLKLYFFLIETFGRLLRPFASRFVDRKLGLEILKYDLLWGIQGTHYGVPVAIPEHFEVPTARTEACSPKTVISYKIEVQTDKRGLEFPGRDPQ